MKYEFYAQRQMGEYEEGASEAHIKQLRWMKRNFLRSNPIVVDVGCGASSVGYSISTAIGNSTIIGIDLSQPALKTASGRGISGVQADFDGLGLPIQSESVDVVVLNEIIEHVVHTDELIDEIYRILKSNGVLLLSTPNLAAWFNRIALLLGVQPAFSEVSYRRVYGRPGNDVVGHLRLFTLRSLKEFLASNGFQIENIEGVTFGALPKYLHFIDALITKSRSLAAGLAVIATKSA